MKFYEYREELPKKQTERTKERLLMLWSFVNSGYKVAEVDIRPEYSSVHSAYYALYKIAKTNNVPVSLAMRKNKLYFLRKEGADETKD